MALLFQNADKHYSLGCTYFQNAEYDHALREFKQAVKDGRNECILDIFSCLQQQGRIKEGIDFLEECIQTESDNLLKIKICNTLIRYNSSKKNVYSEIAAYFGDDKAQAYLCKEALKYHNEEQMKRYFTLLTTNDRTSKNELKQIWIEIMNYLVKNSVSRDCNDLEKINNISFAGIDYLGCLEYISDSELFDRSYRGYANLLIGKYYLINKALVTQDKYIEYYENINSLELGNKVFNCFLTASKQFNVIEANYYLGLMFTFGIGVDKNIKYAEDVLQILVNTQNSKNKTIKFPYAEDYFALYQYVNSLNNVDYLLNNLDTIVGNSKIKSEIRNEVKVLNRKNMNWDFTSDFNKLLPKNNNSEYQCFVFDGEDSTCKKTISELYYNVLKNCGMPNLEYRALNPLDVNRIQFLSDKLNYINSIFNIENDEKLFVYIEKPYLIAGDIEGISVYNLVLQNIFQIIENRNNKYIVVFAGKGNEIVEQFNQIGIKDYTYKVTSFGGYNGDETCQLIERLCENNNVSFCLDIYEEIRRMSKNYSLTNGKNLNYSTIQYIFNKLCYRYFTIVNDDNRNDIRNYYKLINEIENSLGIEEKTEMDLEEAVKDLNSMIGLENIKEQVRYLIDTVKVNNLRSRCNLKPINHSMHMVFSGNPGTGKTTVAKKMGFILKELGVIQQGHVVEVSRADIVSQYFGSTAKKTRDVLNKALHGVLFIDEAYTLTNGKHSSMKDYGIEAIEEILKFMSDHDKEIVVIVAGYKKEMVDFIQSNPGLQSRFNTWIEFEDYTVEELFEIFKELCIENGFTYDLDVENRVIEDFERAISTKDSNFGNGRYVNNYFKKLVNKLNSYLVRNGILETEHFDQDILNKFTIEIFE